MQQVVSIVVRMGGGGDVTTIHAEVTTVLNLLVQGHKNEFTTEGKVTPPPLKIIGRLKDLPNLWAVMGHLGLPLCGGYTLYTCSSKEQGCGVQS
jgi:hypothetical protein